jgi:hypothetical protein
MKKWSKLKVKDIEVEVEVNQASLDQLELAS